MARIKIKDLPKDMKISGNEIRAIRGGKLRSPTGIIIESGGSQGGLACAVIRPSDVGPGCGVVGRR